MDALDSQEQLDDTEVSPGGDPSGKDSDDEFFDA
jgi:hypothetical protein